MPEAEIFENCVIGKIDSGSGTVRKTCSPVAGFVSPWRGPIRRLSVAALVTQCLLSNSRFREQMAREGGRRHWKMATQCRSNSVSGHSLAKREYSR